MIQEIEDAPISTATSMNELIDMLGGTKQAAWKFELSECTVSNMRKDAKLPPTQQSKAILLASSHGFIIADELLDEASAALQRAILERPKEMIG